MNRVIFARVAPVQCNRLIGDDAGRPIGGGRVHAMSTEVGFGADHEKGPGLVQPIQTSEIDLTAVHDVDGASLRHEHVERMHIVQLGVGNMNETRDVAAQIQQCVHLHRGFG
jgi:hypothetical protein